MLLQGHMVKALWPKVPADVYKRKEEKKNNKMLSEGKKQFHVCMAWGGKVRLQPVDRIPQRTKTYPESSFVFLNEKSV